MKILGSDYDGTLNHGGINENKRAAIRAWRACGNKFGIVSGRAADSFLIAKEKDLIDLDFFIAYNGGMIINEDGIVLHQVACNNVSVHEFLQFVFGLGFSYAHVFDHRHFLVRPNEATLKAGEISLSQLESLPHFFQISIRITPIEETAKAVEQLEKAYGDRLTALQNGVCIDVVPKGVNKAAGLAQLAKLYQAKASDVIAVGDNVNDLDMIRAFRSYAMENGVDAVKEAATFTTESITELILRELKDT